MATEYFSPSGTSISDSTVGIIDDPNFTVYVSLTAGNDSIGKGTLAKPFKTPHRAMFYLQNHFITENGFATIKCAAGRYTFDKSIEVRHPQGNRIGIRGEEPTDYILAKCSQWSSSHASAATNAPGGVLTGLNGTTACRYYETKVHLQDLDWQTTGNALEPTDTTSTKGKGVVNGTSGDYVLVRDWTFAHEDNYDTVHNDWGNNNNTTNHGTINRDNFKNKNASRRSILCGAHPLVESERGATDNDGYVTYNCKYYNSPIYYEYETTTQGTNETKKIWFGGWLGKNRNDYDMYGTDTDSGWIPSDKGYGDYFSNPWPCVTTRNTTNTNPTRFGNTLEGWTGTLTTEDFTGYSTLSHQMTMSGYRPTQAEHCSLNRMLLTHIRTVFEFTDITRPGIDIDGGHLGYIQDLALEGNWKQFSKHLNDSNQQYSDYNEGENSDDNHSGILVHDNASLCYNLGKTGDTSASTKFTNHITQNTMSSEDVTTINVGINGFHSGVRITNDSFANINDVAISNCASAIVCTENSKCSAKRSVSTGLETEGIKASEGSVLHSERSMVAVTGHPNFRATFHNTGAVGVTRGFLDTTFRRGDSIVLNNDSQTPVGIVKRYLPNDENPGVSRVDFYDWSNSDLRGALVSKEDIQEHGLKIEHTGNETDDTTPIQMGDATTYWDTANGSYIACKNVHPHDTNSADGHFAYSSQFNSHLTARQCSAFYTSGGFGARYNSTMHCKQSVVHNSRTAFSSYINGQMTCTDTKVLNVNYAHKLRYNSWMNSSQSIVENARHGYNNSRKSLHHALQTHHIEGLTRFVDLANESRSMSLMNHSATYFNTVGGGNGASTTYTGYEFEKDADCGEYSG